MFSIKHNIKRKIIQIIAFGYSNIHIANFYKGKIYQGKWKQFCNPGLNCYSCPAASMSCPIGSLQAVMGSNKFSFSFYVVGIILAFGVILGRFICGFLCPFGLFQEFIFKLPTNKYKLPRIFKYFKFIVLILFVIILPLSMTNFIGLGKPAFCMLICPAGLLEAGFPLMLINNSLIALIGNIFYIKLIILIFILISCIFIYRFFCKAICPLGAIYGLLNKISLLTLRVDKEKCISCGQCYKICKMDVNPTKIPNSIECIRCGDCSSNCPKNAIYIGFLKNKK